MGNQITLVIVTIILVFHIMATINVFKEEREESVENCVLTTLVTKGTFDTGEVYDCKQPTKEN